MNKQKIYKIFCLSLLTMRLWLSSIILFFYTLTCTGATVYMHQCHGGSLVMLQDSAGAHHKNCPVCQDHEQEDTTSSHTCSAEEGSCCKDFKIDLKKGQEEVESTASFNIMTLSPATLSIIWLVVFNPHLDSQQLAVCPEQLIITKKSPPSYLLHCNFRI